MSDTESQHSVILTSEEIVLFGCGHEGPATYEHELFSRRFKVDPEVLMNRDRCGQCHLDDTTSTITQCSVCGRPIFKRQDCLNDKGKIICLRRDCSIGPMGIDPGVWDGERWIHGIQAGTFKIF